MYEKLFKKKLLLDIYFEFKTDASLLSTTLFCLAKQRNSAEHIHVRHVDCSRDVCDQGEGIPLASPPLRSTKSCFIARNTDASSQ